MTVSFLFDPNRCTGCHACRLACTIENGLSPSVSWRQIVTFNPRRHPAAPVYHLSLACNHCAKAACMDACPALAYSRDRATGAVLLDPGKCIGCRYCAWACPYDAPVFDPARGVMTKCTFCTPRLEAGRKPACAALCPTGALDVADRPPAKPTEAIAGLPATDLEPAIRIAPIRPGRRIPEMDPDPATRAHGFAAPPVPSPLDISLWSEWSLVVFTLLAAGLVAVVTANALAPLAVPPGLFAVASVLAMGVATLHLGRPSRAHRAVLNVRRSWLSREIVALSLFFGVAVIQLTAAPDHAWLGGVATAIGLVGLVCTDQVYRGIRGRPRGLPHSAGVAWTALYLAGLLAGHLALAGVFGGIKLGLYASRKWILARAGRPVRPWASLARLGLGFLVPAVAWCVDPARGPGLVVATAVAGEVIDRVEYYLELERITPRREMAEALRLAARRAPTPARTPVAAPES